MLESADIKTNAFRRLFDGNTAAVAYHLEHQGVSRYEKFRHITTEILGGTYYRRGRRRLGKRFSELVLDEVLACPFVPGAQALLERRAGELPLFVASGTPEGELRTIASARGVADWFAGIYGTPPTKAEIIGRVLDQTALAPDDVVMIGDARTDLDGAQTAGVRFIGRVRPGDRDPFADDAVPVVSDLAELDRRWDELL